MAVDPFFLKHLSTPAAGPRVDVPPIKLNRLSNIEELDGFQYDCTGTATAVELRTHCLGRRQHFCLHSRPTPRCSLYCMLYTSAVYLLILRCINGRQTLYPRPCRVGFTRRWCSSVCQFVCPFVCLSPKRIYTKTKQLRAMVFTDDQWAFHFSNNPFLDSCDDFEHWFQGNISVYWWRRRLTVSSHRRRYILLLLLLSSNRVGIFLYTAWLWRPLMPANEWNIAMCHAVWIYGNKLILISHVPLR